MSAAAKVKVATPTGTTFMAERRFRRTDIERLRPVEGSDLWEPIPGLTTWREAADCSAGWTLVATPEAERMIADAKAGRPVAQPEMRLSLSVGPDDMRAATSAEVQALHVELRAVRMAVAFLLKELA